MTPAEVKAAMIAALRDTLPVGPAPEVTVKADVGRVQFAIRPPRGAVVRQDDGTMLFSRDFLSSDCFAAMQLDYLPPMEPGMWSFTLTDYRCGCGALLPAGWVRVGYVHDGDTDVMARRFACAECARTAEGAT